MVSEKTQVVKYLFEQRYDAVAGTLRDSVVTFDDIVGAIQQTGASLSTANPANFFKDIVRSRNREAVWPDKVVAAGYTAIDAIDAPQGCFRFVPLPPGQTTKFPSPLTPPTAALEDPTIIQTLSLPVAAKRLGRADETWLTQLAVRLFLVETHFAHSNPRALREITYLQSNIKLRSGEVDSAYEALSEDGKRYLITCEVKGPTDEIWLPQVLRASEAFLQTDAAIDARGKVSAHPLPFAIKALGNGLVFTVDFDHDQSHPDGLVPISQQVFLLSPGIDGI